MAGRSRDPDVCRRARATLLLTGVEGLVAGVTIGVDHGRGIEQDEARAGVGHGASPIRRSSRVQRGSA